MHSRWFKVLSIAAIAAALGTGCAPSSEDGTNADDTSSESALRTQTDAAIQGKLKGILRDVVFMSEGDSPYFVFEGEATDAKRLSTKLVRQKLAAAVKAQTPSARDILPTTCRSRRLNVSDAILPQSSDPIDEDDYAGQHDRKLSIALKYMRAALTGVVGFTFGTSASGDQDEFGPVVYVYVGISKTTGKLIAIATEAVYT
jgi:hypothetical protein